MSAPDLDALYDDALTDACIADHFGAEPVADPSGVLLPVEPLPADADEDAQFAAVMGSRFPGLAG